MTSPRFIVVDPLSVRSAMRRVTKPLREGKIDYIVVKARSMPICRIYPPRVEDAEKRPEVEA